MFLEARPCLHFLSINVFQPVFRQRIKVTRQSANLKTGGLNGFNGFLSEADLVTHLWTSLSCVAVQRCSPDLLLWSSFSSVSLISVAALNVRCSFSCSLMGAERTAVEETSSHSSSSALMCFCFFLGPPAEASSWSEVSCQTCELKNPLEQTNSLKPVKMKDLPSLGFHHAGQLRCGWQRETDAIDSQLQPSERSGVPEDVCDAQTGTYGVSRPVSCASVDLPPSIPPSFFL